MSLGLIAILYAVAAPGWWPRRLAVGALVAWTGPAGWTGLLSPAFMLYLILAVTGIPPTEAAALKSRGDDYRDYQRSTSAFLPWFPRDGAS